ncbi:MAG: UpxY family transcription antiterminator [Chlorobiaceae bacterium]|nr:UpxY family transcription antiterminator [Chlorobiales bacterium]NTU91830.1 UpxY family transcription antiterminator [Chlorobiaceae bacterium]NTV26617.1 UpxY family transcription antiterminator [Chlorobiaceae bacterium]
MEDLQREWYAVYVRSRQEKAVFRQLQENEVNSFLPLIETVRKWSDRKKKVLEPLFRGYVFVRINHHKEHVKVLDVDGVVRFIGIGRHPSVIAERDIDWLRRLVREPDAINRTVMSIPPGKKVKVLAGPFKDFEGVVVKEGRDERLVVFFDSIMQGVEITIQPEFLRPISGIPLKSANDGTTTLDDAAKHLAHP